MNKNGESTSSNKFPTVFWSNIFTYSHISPKSCNINQKSWKVFLQTNYDVLPFSWIFYSEQMIETWQQSHFKAQHEKLTEVGYELPPPVECCFELLASRSLSERLHKTHFLVTALGEMLCNMVWGKFCDLVDCGIWQLYIKVYVTAKPWWQIPKEE